GGHPSRLHGAAHGESGTGRESTRRARRRLAGCAPASVGTRLGNSSDRRVGEDWMVPDIVYRSLGRSGLQVSTVGLGCNNFGRRKTATESQAGTNAVVSAALDLGVTLFDTADIYGGTRGLSESLMGNAL